MRLTLTRRHPGYWPRVLRDGEPTEFFLNEGSFQDTSDDRLGRWYIQRDSDSLSDKRGPGFASQAAALEALAEQMELEALGG